MILCKCSNYGSHSRGREAIPKLEWNEIVNLSLLFLEAIAFESVIFITDFSYSAFHYKACAFSLFAPFRKVTVWPALPLIREISSTLNINVTFLRTWGLGHG